MKPDDAALAAVGITLAVSVGIILYLHAYMSPLLHAKGTDPIQAKFWMALTHVLLVLAPLAFQLTVTDPSASRQSDQGTNALVLGTVKWGLLGHVAVIGFVAFVTLLSGFGRSVPVWVPQEHADDLNRLMSRVREMRAREIVEKADGEVVELGPDEVTSRGRI